MPSCVGNAVLHVRLGCEGALVEDLVAGLLPGDLRGEVGAPGEVAGDGGERRTGVQLPVADQLGVARGRPGVRQHATVVGDGNRHRPAPRRLHAGEGLRQVDRARAGVRQLVVAGHGQAVDVRLGEAERDPVVGDERAGHVDRGAVARLGEPGAVGEDRARGAEAVVPLDACAGSRHQVGHGGLLLGRRGHHVAGADVDELVLVMAPGADLAGGDDRLRSGRGQGQRRDHRGAADQRPAPAEGAAGRCTWCL